MHLASRRLSKPRALCLNCTLVYQNEPINMSSPLSSYGSLMPEEFDIIVCGGGSCGCVVAGRSVSPCR